MRGPCAIILGLSLLGTAGAEPADAPLAVAAAATVADDAPGAAIYARHCAACHDAGPGHPGTMRLGIRIDGAHAVLRERTDLTSDYVKHVVRQGLQMMPPFRPSEIGEIELGDVAAYVARRYQAP